MILALLNLPPPLLEGLDAKLEDAKRRAESAGADAAIKHRARGSGLDQQADHDQHGPEKEQTDGGQAHVNRPFPNVPMLMRLVHGCGSGVPEW